uniref:Uncharacterized protein n=1 Tax=Sphaerodactylus townsendi TaxID=933632 RepID=A0ACB8EM05_9SAUR
MYDCMEAFAVAPRQLYDVTNRGPCMLRKSGIGPCFVGLDHFAWPQPASLQCSILNLFAEILEYEREGSK